MRILSASGRGARLGHGSRVRSRVVSTFCASVICANCSPTAERSEDHVTSDAVSASAGNGVASEAPTSEVSHESTSPASPGMSGGQGVSGTENTTDTESRGDDRAAGTTESGSDPVPGETASESAAVQTRNYCRLALFSLPGEYGLAAQFETVTSDAPLKQVTAGDCTLTEYVLPRESTKAYLDAGTIHLTGEGIDYPESYSLELTRSESGDYASDLLLTGKIPGRADLHIWSSGGVDVNAFELDLSFPLSLILTAPGVGADGALQISAAGGAELQWERGVEDVFLHIEGLHDTDTRRYYMSCWFPSVPGTGSISAEVLAPFVGAQVEVHTVIKKELQVGMYDLEVRGAREVYNPDKSLNVWGEVVP